MLFKSADKELEELGFIKEYDEDNKESKYSVSYKKMFQNIIINRY